MKEHPFKHEITVDVVEEGGADFASVESQHTHRDHDGRSSASDLSVPAFGDAKASRLSTTDLEQGFVHEDELKNANAQNNYMFMSEDDETPSGFIDRNNYYDRS